MARLPRSRDEALLAARLRTEAARSRPRFSEVLHARLWHGILQSRHERAGSHAAARRPRWPTWTAAVASATVSLAVAILIWRSDWAGGVHRPQPRPLADQATSGARVPDDGSLLTTKLALHSVAGLAAAVPDQIDALVDSAISEPWASLDDDAQLAVKMFADRLPFDLASSLTMAEPVAGP